MVREGMRRRDVLALALAAGAVPGRAAGAPAHSDAARQREGALGSATPLPLERQPIAVFSKHLQWLDYGAAADAAAEAGFDALDVPVRPRGHVEPERVEADLPRAVEAARKAGLSVTMITTSLTSASDPHAETVLRTAGRLGIRHYRMGYVQYGKEGVRRTLDGLVSRLKVLAALGETAGVFASYQNHAGDAFGAAIWDLLLVLEKAGSRRIGCQYDVRHNVVEGAYSWVRDLEVIAPFVHTLVAKDFDWAHTAEGWRVRNVPLGRGMVPLAEWVGELRRLGVSAPLCMHFEYALADEGASPAERRKQTVAALRRDLETLRAALATRPAPIPPQVPDETT